MGIDYYSCVLCREAFPDVVDYGHCSNCHEELCADCRDEMGEKFGVLGEDHEAAMSWGADSPLMCDDCNKITLDTDKFSKLMYALTKHAAIEGDVKLTEKERLLTSILESIVSSCVNMPYADYYRNGHEYKSYVGWFEGDNSVKIGDLVMCVTIRDKQYKFGYVVKKHNSCHMDIRELGTNNICSISNESFYPIRNLRKLDMLEGKEYDLYKKVIKAFQREDEYLYKFSDISFEPENIAVVTIRKKFSEDTFNVRFKYDSKTTIKYIVEEMRKQGYGTNFS